MYAGDAVFAAGELAFPDLNRIRLRSVSFTYWQYETYHRIGWRASQGNGECAVALASSEVRGTVERACARQDVVPWLGQSFQFRGHERGEAAAGSLRLGPGQMAP